MPPFCVLLACGLVGPLEARSPAPLRYLKPEGGRYVLESELTTAITPHGSTTVSRTVRKSETMTLTIYRDKAGRVVGAALVQQSRGKRKTATLELRGETARLKQGDTVKSFKTAVNPVVTTAPDWSDVFELIRRYDVPKGGKQEFPGLWFHPSRAHLLPVFSVERLGEDRVKVKGMPQKLGRYRVRLRSAGYTVWARADRRVCKILPSGAKAVPVVLEGYEEATRPLKGRVSRLR